MSDAGLFPQKKGEPCAVSCQVIIFIDRPGVFQMPANQPICRRSWPLAVRSWKIPPAGSATRPGARRFMRRRLKNTA